MEMSLPSELICHIVDLLPPFKSVCWEVDEKPYYVYPRWILKLFLALLPYKTDNGINPIGRLIRLVRLRNKVSIHIGSRRGISPEFELDPYHNRVGFRYRQQSEDEDEDDITRDITAEVYKHFKPRFGMGDGMYRMYIKFDTPEQICVAEKESGYGFEIKVIADARQGEPRLHKQPTEPNTVHLLSDWLFHFLVEGATYETIPTKYSTAHWYRLQHKNCMEKHPYLDLRNASRREKKAGMKRMLTLWKIRNPSLFGNLNIRSCVAEFQSNKPKRNLHQIVYSY